MLRHQLPRLRAATAEEPANILNPVETVKEEQT